MTMGPTLYGPACRGQLCKICPELLCLLRGLCSYRALSLVIRSIQGPESLESYQANSGPNSELRANSTKPSVVFTWTNMPGKWVHVSVRVLKDRLNSVCLISLIPLESLKGETECSIIYLSDPKVVFPEQSKNTEEWAMLILSSRFF